ncbi:MAG TPA: hypothetical protein DEB31_10475 [Clostridiales bacterium]|nr:hypothetical protein [Clostridiales bacterium]
MNISMDTLYLEVDSFLQRLASYIAVLTVLSVAGETDADDITSQFAASAGFLAAEMERDYEQLEKQVSISARINKQFTEKSDEG